MKPPTMAAPTREMKMALGKAKREKRFLSDPGEEAGSRLNGGELIGFGDGEVTVELMIAP
jgi:hypothetical protein